MLTTLKSILEIAEAKKYAILAPDFATLSMAAAMIGGGAESPGRVCADAAAQGSAAASKPLVTIQKTRILWQDCLGPTFMERSFPIAREDCKV